MNQITDIKNAPHYVWGNGCDSWVLAENHALSVKQETMPPGARERLHFHSSAQQYFFILKGRATFYVDDARILLSERQGLLIGKLRRHFIANETEEVLEFLVISQPAINNDRTDVDEMRIQ